MPRRCATRTWRMFYGVVRLFGSYPAAQIVTTILWLWTTSMFINGVRACAERNLYAAHKFMLPTICAPFGRCQASLMIQNSAAPRVSNYHLYQFAIRYLISFKLYYAVTAALEDLPVKELSKYTLTGPAHRHSSCDSKRKTNEKVEIIIGKHKG